AGRTGRGPRGGQVLVQTFNPEHPAIALAATHDYAGFVATELVHRQAHNYPPFHRLARLIVRSQTREAAAAFAQRLAAHCPRVARAINPRRRPARSLAPAGAAVSRPKGSAPSPSEPPSPTSAALPQLRRAVLPSLRPPAGVEFTIDVDPLNML